MIKLKLAEKPLVPTSSCLLVFENKTIATEFIKTIICGAMSASRGARAKTSLPDGYHSCGGNLHVSTFPAIEHMYSVSSFFTADECQAWIAKMEDKGGNKLVAVKQNATRDYARRKHSRMQLDNREVADSIFERVRSFVPQSLDSLRPVGCSPNIRLYKYTKGDSFGPHIDESNPGPSPGTVSKFTLLVYLSSLDGEKDGGRTIFYADHGAKRQAACITPKAGLLLLHGHGDRCLTHEAEEIYSSAAKYVFRTDVLYG